MFYIAIFLVLLCLSYCEYKGIKIKYLSLETLFVIITIITIFRYGQGTDYFAYEDIYAKTPALTAVSSIGGIFSSNGDVEFGYVFLIAIFKTLRLNFEAFCGFSGIITMMLFYRFIKKNAKLPITAFSIFYVFYYLVYVLSGMRQGLAMAIFVGIGIELYKRKKYKEFILLVLVTAAIHVSVLVTLVVFVLDKLGDNYKFYSILGILAILIIYFNFDVAIINLMPDFLSEKLSMYITDGRASMISFINRFTVLALILFYSFGDKEDKDLVLFKKLYIFSFILYVLTMKSMTISTRMTLYFKIFEIILIPNIVMNLLKNNKKFKALQLYGASMLIVAVLLVKTLNAFLDEGYYKDHVNVINYPYVTIFNKDHLWYFKKH